MSEETRERGFMERLLDVQARLKAPKGQENKFGGYRYRSCEDILEAVKPLLAENALLLNVSDTIFPVPDMGGDERYYVRATATVFDALGDKSLSSTAYAREPLAKKGTDPSQITGATSSYARKYALNGLFLIDDTRDADATNAHGKDMLPKEQANELRKVFANYRDHLGVSGADAAARLREVCGVESIGNDMSLEDFAKVREHMLREIAGAE